MSQSIREKEEDTGGLSTGCQDPSEGRFPNTGTPGLVVQDHPRVHWLNLIKLEETTAKHEP